MAADEEECKCPPPGLPAWMGTFADLMSLLMAFFVLLLSFSEMDVLKYKQIAGSMKNAFGVQSQVKVKDIPKGTSVVAQEFAPGKPEPTLIQTVQQQTTDQEKQSLDFDTATDVPDEEKETDGKEDGGDKELESMELENAPTEATEQVAKDIAENLKDELISGQIELEAAGRIVIIRIRERGSFSSGSAQLRPQIKPALAKIRDIVKQTTGEIRVAGHTDDRPIKTPLYPSNWELSGARAASVLRELISTKELDENRFSIYGLAYTRPLAPNTNARNRSRNRRVEVMIVQGGNITTTRQSVE